MVLEPLFFQKLQGSDLHTLIFPRIFRVNRYRPYRYLPYWVYSILDKKYQTTLKLKAKALEKVRWSCVYLLVGCFNLGRTRFVQTWPEVRIVVPSSPVSSMGDEEDRGLFTSGRPSLASVCVSPSTLLSPSSSSVSVSSTLVDDQVHLKTIEQVFFVLCSRESFSEGESMVHHGRISFTFVPRREYI